MIDFPEALPGLEHIRMRFLRLLEERQAEVAHHALSAWNTGSPDSVHASLQHAQEVLHQIHGSAGSLGFDTLGQAARECENQIIAFLEETNVPTADVPSSVMAQIDSFVCVSQALVDGSSARSG